MKSKRLNLGGHFQVTLCVNGAVMKSKRLHLRGHFQVTLCVNGAVMKSKRLHLRGHFQVKVMCQWSGNEEQASTPQRPFLK